MRILFPILIFLFCTSDGLAQKMRLEGDNSRFLCLNDSIAETFLSRLASKNVDSTISILYDYNNGRLPNSRKAIIWTTDGSTYLKVIEGCDKIIMDTTLGLSADCLWNFIGVTKFPDASTPIESKFYQSHDKFYHIEVKLPRKSFYFAIMNYEREEQTDKREQMDSRARLANMIDELIKRALQPTSALKNKG